MSIAFVEYTGDDKPIIAGTLMDWTTTAPTQEGWYWVVRDYPYYEVPPLPFMAHVMQTPYCFILESGDHPDVLACKGYYWIGPLPVPEFTEL